MKIPQEHHQFSGERALLVVTGSQDALFYSAGDGELVQHKPLQAEDRQPDDSPGVVINKTGDSVRHAVSLEDRQQQLHDKTVRHFLQRFADHLKEYFSDGRVTSVFLFTPDFMENTVREQLPKTLAGVLVHVFTGNYTRMHPLKLIEKIDGHFNEKKVVPTGGQAAEILRRKQK